MPANEAKLDAALASMNDAVFISDAAGRFVEFNDAFATFHRFKDKASCAKSVDEYPTLFEISTLAGERVPLDEWPIPRALRGEAAAGIEYLLRRLDSDASRVGSFSYAPIRSDAGGVVGCVITARDVTAAKAAEALRESLAEQLRESQKMEAIGTLAGGIAHDFNNLIAAILGNAQLALEDAAGNRAVETSVNEILKAARRARSLVQQILSFGRRQPTERRLVSLAPIVDEAVGLLRAGLPARIRLEVFKSPDVALVLADPNQIEQVILNLVSNATQALQGQPGNVEIRLEGAPIDADLIVQRPALKAHFDAHAGPAVRLAVSDDGVGMDRATFDKIFEPFFTTKPVGEGTGIGLSVVLGIVQAHDGVVLVDSVEGKGTTFSVYLPGVEAGSPARHADVEAGQPGLRAAKHVLSASD